MRLTTFSVTVGICSSSLVPRASAQGGADEIFAVTVTATAMETGHP